MTQHDTAQDGGKPHAIRLMNAVFNNEHKFTTFNYYNFTKYKLYNSCRENQL